MKMTAKAKDFVECNDKSEVESGSAIGNGGEGGIYTLKDGKTFRLTVDDLKSLPEGYPKWYNPSI